MQAGDKLSPEEQDWHRFQQLDHLDNHWQRPGWVEGRHSYHWLLTFEHASDLHTLAARCQEPFRKFPHFDLVPLDALHLTIQRVAFTDELPASTLPAVVATGRQRCRDVAPFRLRIGWLAGSAGAIRFTALPVTPVVEVRAMTAIPSPTVDIPDHIPTCATEKFWPHVSIAYSHTTQPTAPVITQIEALRHLPSAEVLVTSVALVELRREGRVYRWEVVGRVGLGE
ncbi:MAG: 2'-5' RNA ligase family protein [Pseudonocardiaceae bacterium]